MPQRPAWEPDFNVGHPLIDSQHQALLALCNRLADHCAGPAGPAADQAFDHDFDQLKALAQEHFQAESALLAERDYPALEQHQFALDEFDDLLADIVTTQGEAHVETVEIDGQKYEIHVFAAGVRG